MGWLDPVFEGLSAVGALGAVWIVVALLVALLRGRRGLFVSVVVAVAVADLAARAIQAGVGRDRPPLQTPEPAALVRVPHTGSFPSGHAATSFAAATVLALAVSRATAHRAAEPRSAQSRSARSRSALLRFAGPSAVLALALAVAFSRLYVGVHYPLDTLAGAALGTAIGVGVCAVTDRRARRGGAAGG